MSGLAEATNWINQSPTLTKYIDYVFLIKRMEVYNVVEKLLHALAAQHKRHFCSPKPGRNPCHWVSLRRL